MLQLARESLNELMDMSFLFLHQNVIVKDEFETLHERINDQREFYKLKVIHGGVYYQAWRYFCLIIKINQILGS